MERFRSWPDRYAAAWILGDPEVVAGLFAPDARYQDSSFAEPFEGREAIRDYWAQGARHSKRDVQYEAQVLAIGQEVGVAHWHSEFTSEPLEHRVQLDGVLAATLDDAGLCADFREWWHRREGHE